MATVVLGDDHVVFLDALSTVLSQHGHIVCGVARNAAEMVTLVRVHQPDACLIDHNAPGDEDAETIRTVLAACAGTSVIVLGASSCSDTVGRALDAGQPVTCTSPAGSVRSFPRSSACWTARSSSTFPMLRRPGVPQSPTWSSGWPRT